MAIAFDAVSSGAATGGSYTSLTVSHTVTGSNTILFVGVHTYDATAGEKVSGITYNGVAMTQLAREITGGAEKELWYLINPATGTHNIVLSCASQLEIFLVAASYTGVKQSGFPDAYVSVTNTPASPNTSITGTVTTIADNCWVVMLGTSNNGDLVAGANTTSRVESPTLDVVGLFDNNGPKTPAGSVTLNLTCTGGNNRSSTIASFAPVAAGPANLKSYNTNLKANIKSIDTNLIANTKSLNTNV